MREKKLRVCLLVWAAAIMAVSPVFSQSNVAQGDGGRNGAPMGDAPGSGAAAEGVQLFIRFYNQKIYYQNRTEQIMVKVSVVNRSGTPYSFKLADRTAFNVGFDVRTPGNISLDPADEFTIERSSDQPVFFKELTVKPEEEYGVVVRLNRFVELDRPGVFYIQARFYPDLYRGVLDEPLTSNVLTLHLRPSYEGTAVAEMMEEETGRTIAREELPPDEVVRFTLEARQKEKWEQFFLYMDLESLLLKNPEWRPRYVRQSEEERKRLLAEYRDLLKSNTVDEDIVVKPIDFEIQRTTYTPVRGQVTVIEKFQYPDFVEVKEYTYVLERKGDPYWDIVDYSVRNIGTE